MKKDKKHFKEVLLEGLLELALTLLCFGIGALIVGLFGFGARIADMDFELIALLGLAATLVIFAGVYALVQGVKKRVKSRKHEKDSSEK